MRVKNRLQTAAAPLVPSGAWARSTGEGLAGRNCSENQKVGTASGRLM